VTAPQYQQQPGAQPPNNYLVWAILTTVLCCPALGIVSIVKSTQVNNLWAQGNHEGARAASESAKKWAMWAAILGVVLSVIGIIVNLTLLSNA
jgi:hypothetical protein